MFVRLFRYRIKDDDDVTVVTL